MATSRDEIREWLEEGKTNGSTHVIIVCDTWDYEDYPVYVTPAQNVNEVAKQYQRDMQKVMEIFHEIRYRISAQ